MPRRIASVILTVLAIFIVGLSHGCSLNSGDLEIEAQIIYSMGGPQPVARETFYLLDADIARLSGLQKAYLDAYTLNLRVSDFLMGEGQQFWSAHVVQSAQTDFQGRATFEGVKPGNYWVVGRAQARGNKHLIWNVKVTVGRGKNKLMLSNDNYGFKWPNQN